MTGIQVWGPYSVAYTVSAIYMQLAASNSTLQALDLTALVTVHCQGSKLC